LANEIILSQCFELYCKEYTSIKDWGSEMNRSHPPAVFKTTPKRVWCATIAGHWATLNFTYIHNALMQHASIPQLYRTLRDRQTNNFRHNTILYFCRYIFGFRVQRPSTNRENFIRCDLHSFPRKIVRTRPNWFARGVRTRCLNNDDSGAAATGWIEFVTKVKKWRNKTLPSSGGHNSVQALSPLYPRGVSIF